jgi:TolB protein
VRAVLGLCLVVLLAGGCERRASSAPPATAASGSLSAEIAYEKDVDGNTDIYVIPAGGGVERRLTDEPRGDGMPRWTSDGKRIVFNSERTGEWQLWEMQADGSGLRRLRTNDAREFQSDPSPDDRQIAFLSYIEGHEKLFVMDRSSGAARVLVDHGDVILGNPHWSPDGKQITYSSNAHIGHQIYRIDVATAKESRVSGLTSGGCEPRFSRDGKKIVYVSRGHMRPTSRLVEHDIESDEEKVLVDWPALNYDPVYSPDGTEIAFASNITGEWVLYRQRLSDQKSWRLTFGKGGARSPDYRPR